MELCFPYVSNVSTDFSNIPKFWLFSVMAYNRLSEAHRILADGTTGEEKAKNLNLSLKHASKAIR